MRALLKKELTEVLVPFGVAFLVIAMFWLASVRFWDALLPPASMQLMVVAVTSALAGAVLGYLQFSAERWRGKLGYLVHRGTGVEGAFLAKTIAGLTATALVGLGPPLLYALSAALLSPNASILQVSLLWAYASAATAGASLYSLGALAASLRRRSIAGILLIPLGGVGLWVFSEMIGTPWGNASTDWLFPTLQLALAAVLLGLGLSLARSSIDRDLALPRGAHIAALLLALPLVLLPCDIGASILNKGLLDEARSEYAMILRDRATEEIFPVVPGENGSYFRLEAGGRTGERVEPNAPQFDTVFYGRAIYGVSEAGPLADRYVMAEGLLVRRDLIPIGYRFSSRGFEYGSLISQNVRTLLDRERGVVRAFGCIPDFVPPNVDGLRSVPFELELGKPEEGTTFSAATLVLHAENGAVERRARSIAPEESAGSQTDVEEAIDVFGRRWRPGIQVDPCLLDPGDGSFWRLDVLDAKAPLKRVQLPGGDRFVRLGSLYQREDLIFGRYGPLWKEPVVVGERGRYVWNGLELVEFLTSDTHATVDEAPSLFRYRVVVEDPDPLRWTVRVFDAKDDREVFAYVYAPRTRGGSVLAAAGQASVLLRSPLANTLIFTGVIRHRRDRGFVAGSELTASVRRPWLWALVMMVGLACAGICARFLRRRNASPIGIALGSVFALLFGPVGLLVVWLLEPKGRARELPAARAVPEPALVIQSA